MNPSTMIGLGGGAAGSLAGQLFGVLDAPRRSLWGMIPGLHDADTGEAYTGEHVARDMLGVADDTESMLTPALAQALGFGLQTALDPLTFAAGPLGGMVGGRIGRAAADVGLANRAAKAAEAIPALRGTAAAAENAFTGASAAAEGMGKVALGSKGGYPTETLLDALTSGNTAPLRRYGGVSGLGSVVNRPPSQFLIDQLERQGFGMSMLDKGGNVGDKFLLAGDPYTRSLFAPKGGRLTQLAEVAPEVRGPLSPLVSGPPAMPSVGEAIPPSELYDLSRRSPILSALLGDVGGFSGFSGLPADQAAGMLHSAASGTEGGLASIRNQLSSSPWERLYARLFTHNPLGV